MSPFDTSHEAVGMLARPWDNGKNVKVAARGFINDRAADWANTDDFVQGLGGRDLGAPEISTD